MRALCTDSTNPNFLCSSCPQQGLLVAWHQRFYPFRCSCQRGVQEGLMLCPRPEQWFCQRSYSSTRTRRRSVRRVTKRVRRLLQSRGVFADKFCAEHFLCRNRAVQREGCMTGRTGMRGCEVEPAELEGGTLGPFSMRGRPYWHAACV